MKPTLIVARSELLRRVTFKAFILTTLLVPLVLVGFFTVVVIISTNAVDSDMRTIAVVDETGFVLDRLLRQEDAAHVLVRADSTTVREAVLAGRYDGYVMIPSGVLTRRQAVSYFTAEGGGFGMADYLQHRIRNAIRDQRMAEAHVPPDVLEILDTPVVVRSIMLDREGEEAGNPALYGDLGIFMAFMMYFALILYANAIFRGVMEEKRSRVVEVLMASVRSAC